MESNPNPRLFRELNEPFEHVEAANAAVDAFIKDLGALRKKYKISNLLTVIGASALTADGEEMEFLMPHIYGDFLRAESMAAYAYGNFASERQERIGKFSSGQALVSPKRPK